MGLMRIPGSMLQTSVTVVIQNTPDEYGVSTGLTVIGKCRLVEKSTRVFDAEKRLVTLPGYLYMDGDIAPSVPVIESGEVTIDSRTWQIYSAERPRDPSGLVHHTKLYLR